MPTPEEEQPSVPAGKTYTATEVAQFSLAFRQKLRTLVEQHSELALARDEFNDVVHHAADPLQEIAALLDACLEVLLQLRHLVNPIALPLHMTEDGRVQGKRD